MSYINDGFQTWITFALDPAVKFKEREVTPPNIEAGGEIDTTTMRNTRWRTKQPKSLVTLGNITLSANYDPAVYTSILALIGKNGAVEVKFADGSTLSFFGWIDSFKPGALKEGEFPTAEVTIICSNTHPTTKAESEPTYAAA